MATVEQGSGSHERSVLRWGGLAGMLGGIVFVFVPVVLFGFVPPTPTDPAAVVARFPNVETAIALGNNINLVADILILALVLALYRALRGTSPAPALFGAVMSVLALGVLFTETQTQVAFAPLSDLYRAPGATAAQQATLALIWQATQGMFTELDVAAGVLLSAGFIVLGVAMFQTRSFGKGLGLASIVLSAVALVAIALIPVLGEASIVAVLALPVYILLPIVWGWKTYRLSKAA